MPLSLMDLQHPIDAEVRERLRKLGPNQVALATAIGRNQSWLHKFMNGTGHATIDDVIRIAAALIGVEAQPLTETERKLLRAYQQLEEPDRLDVIAYAQHRARLARRGPSKESSETAADTPPVRVRRARGTR